MNIGRKEKQMSVSFIPIPTRRNLLMEDTYPRPSLKLGMLTNKWTVLLKLEKKESLKRWWHREVVTVQLKDWRKQEIKWKKQTKTPWDPANSGLRQREQNIKALALQIREWERVKIPQSDRVLCLVKINQFKKPDLQSHLHNMRT
jgi:hypothetical protein